MRTKFSTLSRCFGLKWLVLAVAVLLASAATMAQAPASIFQLNGNPASTGQDCTPPYTTAPTTCDSWNGINLAGSSGAGRLHSGVNAFILGTTNTDNFTGGGSKDPSLISSWAYTSTSTPNKDTLNAAYAAAYSVSDFDIIFGADRLSPNGDANIGIWFFQQDVHLNGSGGFTGAHVNGDVFVISAFTGGGGTSTISVFSWDSSCASGVKSPSPGQCADTNLRLLASPSTVCGASFYCAITNGGTVSASWASYSGGSLASPLFFEGGVDITQAFAVLGIPVPCFASFLVETRSSQSTTAVLKDFLLGGFPVCSMSITKSCGTSSVNAAGTSFVYPVSGTVTNTGIGTLYDVQVTDTVGNGAPGSPISIVNTTTGSKYINTNNLGAGDSGSWSDSSSSTATMSSDQAFAKAATSSGGPQTLQSSNTATASCMAQANSTLTVTKSCSTTLQVASGAVSVLVSYGGQICNTGPSTITGIALKDYPDASCTGANCPAAVPVVSSITLGPGTAGNPTCTPYSASYSPTLIDQSVVGGDGIAGDGAGRYFFSDLVVISSATADVGTLTQFQDSSPMGVNYNPDPRINGTYGFGPASCPICKGSSECTP